MGKRKRSKDVEISIGTGTKRAKLENNGDVLDVDPNKVSQSITVNNKNKAAKYYNDKLKMGVSRYIGMSYQELKR